MVKPVGKKLVKKVAKKPVKLAEKAAATKKPEKKVKKQVIKKVAVKKEVVKKAPLKSVAAVPVAKKIEAKKPVAVKKNLAHGLDKAKESTKPLKKISKKDESWVIRNRTFILVLFAAVVVMNSWIYLTTPVYAPTVIEKQITNPVFDEQASYFKYEVPETDWNNFDGKKMVEKLLSSGVRFDEAIYQEGGKACDVCPSTASPLLFLKNPSGLGGGNWLQVAKPGFYENTERYPVYQYLLK